MRSSSVKRLVVLVSMAAGFWAISLVAASALDLDPRLGVAPVSCAPDPSVPAGQGCAGPMEAGDTYEVLFFPWPPFTWYSMLAAAVGAVLGVLLISSPAPLAPEATPVVPSG